MPELFYQDNYDYCMMRQGEAFYCSITYVLEPLNKEYPPEIWYIIREHRTSLHIPKSLKYENVSDLRTNYRHDQIRHWIWLPKACPEVSKSDENDPLLRRDCYNKKCRHFELKGTISEIACETAEPKYPVDWLDIIYGMSFGAYISFVLYGTYYEGVARYKTPEEYRKLTTTSKGKLLSAFSLTKNWIKLKTINSTPEIEKLRGIQGIRVYNSSLVIMAHVLMWLAIPIANTRYPETIHEKHARLLFSSGPLCVATFFFISSFLLSNSLFDYMKEKNRLSFKISLFIFSKRFFRLTPSLAVVVLFNATWLRHLGNGPNWNALILLDYKNCRTNWWTNLLYINNWVDYYNMCLPTSWYLSLDTQYFVISLVFIWILKAYEKYIWYLIGAAISLNILGTFWQNYYYDFTALILSSAETFYGFQRFLDKPQYQYQICSFIGNMAAPIMGIAYGYYFHKHKNDKPEDNIFTTKFRVFMWWMLTFGLFLSFVIKTGLIFLQDTTEHNAFWASIHVAVARPITGFVVGTAIIGLSEGVGWLVLRVLQWPPTYVLGRLSFSAYLVHMNVVIARPALARFPQYVTDFELIMACFGDLFVSFICATVLTLFVELPISELQKLIFNQKEGNYEDNIKKAKKAI